jgi:RNA polymerase-binding protein DksA
MVADKTAGTKKTASTGTTGAAAGEQPADEEQSGAPAKSAVADRVTEVAEAAKTAGKKAVSAVRSAPAKRAEKAGAPAVPVGTARTAAPEEGTAARKTARTAVRKATAGKAAARTASAAPAGGAGNGAASAAEGAAEAAETGAETVVVKKSPGSAATAGEKTVPAAGAVSGELAVRPGEDPWTPEEVSEARAELDSEILRLRAEIASAEEALSGLMRDSGDGAGDDDADTGTKNITREHEMSLAANAREMLEQTERARERLDTWTYGICENCGKPIGKARMQAFPRATLCVECKQKQERRY